MLKKKFTVVTQLHAKNNEDIIRYFEKSRNVYNKAVRETFQTVKKSKDFNKTSFNTYLQNKYGQQASTFAPITISRPVPKQGESNQARRFLDWADKGALIAVEGEFRQGNKFVGKDGSDRYGEHYIRVNNFQILETKATAEARRAQASAGEAK